MPGVHVIGEIVGASELRPHDAFSLTHWLDLISLHPTTTLGYFCRWKLCFRDSSTSTRKEKSSWSHWQVLEGAASGQTHIHSVSPVTIVVESITRISAASQPTEVEYETIELDTVWSHPIDLHLVNTCSKIPSTWPYLEFQVCTIDKFHHHQIIGSASIALPLRSHEFFLDLPIIHRSPMSLIDAAAQMFGMLTSSDQDIQQEDKCVEYKEQNLIQQHVGTLYIRLAVLPSSGFKDIGISIE